MHIKATSLSILSIVLIFLVSFGPFLVTAQSTELNQRDTNTIYNAIYVDNLTITLNNSDANATIHYELDAFTKFYLFVFGGGVIDHELKSILVGFENITTREISEEKAVFHLDNVTYCENDCEEGFHVIDSHKLNQDVKNLTIEFPDGTSMRYRNIDNIPKIRYRLI